MTATVEAAAPRRHRRPRNIAPATQSRIITGDVLQVLRAQPANPKFAVVIADPPYNIGKDFGNATGNRDGRDDNMPIADYVAWCEAWLAECFRLLADDGLIYVYGFAEVLARVAVKFPVDEQRWLAWHYTNKAVPSSKFWQRAHESILCLWQPGRKRPALEVEQIRVPYTAHFKQCAGRERKGTRGRYSRAGKRTIYADNGGALPRDVLSVPALAGGAGRAERWFACRDCGGGARRPAELPAHDGHDILKHPTQKPFALTRQLLLSRVRGDGNGTGDGNGNGDGDGNGTGRALIPFAGSGSECVVAQSLNIPFLGIELNPEFANFATSWVESA